MRYGVWNPRRPVRSAAWSVYQSIYRYWGPVKALTIMQFNDKENIKAQHHFWPSVRVIHRAGDQWIPQTKGQQYRKRSHVMASHENTVHLGIECQNPFLAQDHSGH